ncbi:MAG: hypothetical protein ACRDS9_03735 [Pseudonocardiaceae bacterium]
MSIAGIFALGGGCYDNDKHDYKYKRDHHYSSYGRYDRDYNKCCDDYDDDDDDGLLGGILG